MRRILLPLVAVVLATALMPGVAPAAGPCAPPNAPDPMPTGAGHDHLDASQHHFSCNVEEVAYESLEDLVPEPVWFGEIDRVGDLAVIATAFPTAGFVTLDMSDPADPRPLGRYFGPRCEELVTDVDCGADVKLSSDGTLAFVATQSLSRAFAAAPHPMSIVAPHEPGIIAVDLSDPARPLPAGFLPVPPAGVHMLAYHEIGGIGYVFAVHNQVGVVVARVERAGPVVALVPVATIATGHHDVFLYDDPVDGKTYLYVAAAFNGVNVYDVTDPANPVRVGVWTGHGGLYVHSVWTLRWGDRRLTFVVPELFQGAGDRQVGPVWLLDTTDHANPVLAATWKNPSNRRAGDLGFSPHNIAIAGGVMYLAHYHAGVWVLDWRSVLDGTAATPSEIGYHVPHGGPRALPGSIARSSFILRFDIGWRPSVWDVVTDGTYVYASDIVSGFYVLDPPAA